MRTTAVGSLIVIAVLILGWLGLGFLVENDDLPAGVDQFRRRDETGKFANAFATLHGSVLSQSPLTFAGPAVIGDVQVFAPNFALSHTRSVIANDDGLIGHYLRQRYPHPLGIGVQPPTPDWGADVASSYQYLAAGYWWETLFPALAIASLVVAVNLIADSIEAVVIQ